MSSSFLRPAFHHFATAQTDNNPALCMRSAGAGAGARSPSPLFCGHQLSFVHGALRQDMRISSLAARQGSRQPRPSPLRRLVDLLRRRRVTPPAPGPRPSRHEWRELIVEFEERATTKYSSSGRSPPLPPPGSTPGKRNEAQYESLSLVESAFMVALTTTLWYLGRILRLDALVMLLYPLPTMYVAARWGLGHADRALISTLFLIFTIMGPIYALLYLLNSGLLTATYSRALWWRWSWRATLLAGAVSKGVGLALQLGWMSVVLRYNAWKAVAIQVTKTLHAVTALVNRVAGKAVLGAPGFGQVQVAIAVVIALHSIYHVFFTQLTAALLLHSVGKTENLAREPNPVPGVMWLIKRTQSSKSDYR